MEIWKWCFLRREEIRLHRGKPHRARTRTNNKSNPHMTQVQESKSRHIGERRVLSLLRHTYPPNSCSILNLRDEGLSVVTDCYVSPSLNKVDLFNQRYVEVINVELTESSVILADCKHSSS